MSAVMTALSTPAGSTFSEPSTTTRWSRTRPRPAAADVDGVAGTSASVSQYTSFGADLVPRLIVFVSKRLRPGPVAASYTLSKAEDNRPTTSAVRKTTAKAGTWLTPTGLPIDFDPTWGRGPSVHDQRHRFVLSGIAYGLPGRMQICSIVKIGSGWPHNLLAGVDFNRRRHVVGSPANQSLAAPLRLLTRGTEAGRMPAEATVDLRVQKRLTFGSRRRTRRPCSRSSTCSTARTSRKSTAPSVRACTRICRCPRLDSSPKRGRRDRSSSR